MLMLKLVRKLRGRIEMLSGVVGDFSDTEFPPKGSLRGPSPPKSRGPLGPKQLAWLDENIRGFKVMREQSERARAARDVADKGKYNDA